MWKLSVPDAGRMNQKESFHAFHLAPSLPLASLKARLPPEAVRAVPAEAAQVVTEVFMTKTKIVCTIGPSCNSEASLRALIEAGMDVARLNFSHGTYDEHREVFNRIRKVSEDTGVPIAVLQDLCGPKIRLGEIPPDGFMLREGDIITLTGEKVECAPDRLYVSYPYLAHDLKPGEPVLIDDGLIQLYVEKIQDKDVLCKVMVGGIVHSHKGVNLPGSSLRISALSEKDYKDVEFGVKLGVDFIALSFVRKAEDITELKRFLEERKKFIPIIAKIEKQEAVNNLESILTVANGAMVARGDLGIEIPIEKVPLVQKQIIKMCNAMSKPVITATQMLDSMIRNPIPTRAEVTDIANAILDGTDAVMLSGETASGKYPVEAVKMMDRIASSTEGLMEKQPRPSYVSRHNVVDSVSEATCKIAEELQAKAIIVLTDSGRTARLVSKYKPDSPILAITYDQNTVHRLKLSWGVFPLKVEPTTDTDLMLQRAVDAALNSGIVSSGDLVVTTAGIPAMVKGSTNMIKVDVLGHVFLRGFGVGPKIKVTGKVIICKDAEDALKVAEPGDILVTKRLDDTFVPLSNRLSGIVTEEGSEGSYTDYYCNKFNIPGIIGVPNAASVFFHGQIITIDPEPGIIYGAQK